MEQKFADSAKSVDMTLEGDKHNSGECFMAFLTVFYRTFGFLLWTPQRGVSIKYIILFLTDNFYEAIGPKWSQILIFMSLQVEFQVVFGIHSK